MTLVLSQVGMSQRVEPLLAAMAAGIVIANVAVAQGDALKAAIRSGALPLLVVFFVAVGTSLRLDTLAAAGVAAIGLAVARIGLIWIGVRVGLRAAKVKDRAGEYVWTGLISQAGITLGLAAAVAAEFPTWGTQVQMLLVALIAIDELVGPALFRTGPGARGRDRRDTRRGRCSSCRTASRISTISTITAASRAPRQRAASRWRSTR